MTLEERATLAREIGLAAKLSGRTHTCGCGTSPPPGEPAHAKGHGPSRQSLARRLNQSLTDPTASAAEVERFLAAAAPEGFGAVTVLPCWAPVAVRMLRGRTTQVVSLVGFPLGAALTPAKCHEAEGLLRLGVHELEMVAHVGALRSGDLDAAYIDIKAVAQLVRCRGAKLGVILELPRLTERQRIEACAVAKLAGADYAVTATGCGGYLANPADVALMQRVVGGDLEVVAADGIHSAAEVRRMLEAGATRVATSNGLEILRSVTS